MISDSEYLWSNIFFEKSKIVGKKTIKKESELKKAKGKFVLSDFQALYRFNTRGERVLMNNENS